MKKLLLVLAIAMMAIPSLAQDYTRGKGFFVRPEMYGGFFANVGYQISPYVQVSAGPGVLLLLMNNTGNNVSIDIVGTVHGGVRVYTSGKNPWSALIDYHVGAFRYNRDPIWRHALVGGASYKDLDFGGGLQMMFGPNAQVFGYGPVVTVGYNFRFYKH